MGKKLPPPPGGDVEYIYGMDPITGEITGLVGVKGGVSVPIAYWPEYRDRHGLVVEEVHHLPSAGTLVVVKKGDHE